MTNNAQLDSQLSKMINEFNKQRASGLICDTECQNNQNIRSWQHKVTERENTLANDMECKVDLDVRYARAKILRKLSQLKFRLVQNNNIQKV